jgi:Flp pilus assembly protein CpaB
VSARADLRSWHRTEVEVGSADLIPPKKDWAKFVPSNRRGWVLASTAALVQAGAFLAFSRAPTAEKALPVAVSRGLERGSALTRESVEWSLLAPANNLAERLPEEAFEAALGRFLLRDVPDGQPIRATDLSKEPVLPLEVEKIPPGRVLFPLPVRLGALARLLRPGQKVDVLAHMSLPESGSLTETLLEAVTVVGVGERATDLESGGVTGAPVGDVVSFHLTPEEMKLMVHAQRFSQFHLALRNPRESSNGTVTSAMTINRFLADPRIRKALASDVFRIRSAKDGVSEGIDTAAFRAGEPMERHARVEENAR